MRVHLDESGHHVFVRRVDDGAGVQVVAMLFDALDHARLDHDVGLAADRLEHAVEHVAGVDDDARWASSRCAR